jgi:hypothetical protein
VVMIPRFHEYRPGPPLSAAPLPIKEGPVMYRGPSPVNTVFVGDMITLGSIFSKAFLHASFQPAHRKCQSRPPEGISIFFKELPTLCKAFVLMKGQIQ